MPPKPKHRRRIDFWVPYCENQRELTMKILDYCFLERVRCNKPTILVITGESGEAKSSISQALTEKLLALHNINYAPFVNDVTIYTPFEFPEKEEALLYDKRLKNIPMMIIDEARLVVKAKNWHDFLNQTIADVVALQRRLKRFFLIIITQDLDDIDKDIRRLVTYWGEAYRPLHGDAKLHLSRFYKDTRRPSKIELEKRSLIGIIQYPDGKTKLDFPSNFVFKMPSKEVWKTYDEQNYISKGAILKRKLRQLIDRMKKEAGITSRRIDLLLDYYCIPEKYESLKMHFRNTTRKNWSPRKEAAEFFGLDKTEMKEFAERARERMESKDFFVKKKGVIKNGVSQETTSSV